MSERHLEIVPQPAQGGALMPLGFRLPQNTTYEEYEGYCAGYGQAHEAILFALGDLIIQGKSLFGEEAYQAVEAMGISPESRMQYARVAERIPMERRVRGLSWSHHRAVAGLEPEDQDLWLKRAKESGWSQRDLYEHLAAQRDPRPDKKQRPYVIEHAADAAEAVWDAARLNGDGYVVPREPMETLAQALGFDA